MSRQTFATDACYLGIDPGLNRTGYALLERSSQNDGTGSSLQRGAMLREAGVIRSTVKESLAFRVGEIGAGVREVIDEFQPAMLAIEQVFSMGKNPKTALLMAHARGAILMVAAERKIPVLHYTATQIKKILTGSGRASKEQVQLAIQREFGLKSILQPNDAADASAVALCLYHSVKFAA